MLPSLYRSQLKQLSNSLSQEEGAEGGLLSGVCWFVLRPWQQQRG